MVVSKVLWAWTGWAAALLKRLWGLWQTGTCEPSVPCWKEGPWHLGWYQQQYTHMTWASFLISWGHLKILHLVSGQSTKKKKKRKRHQSTGASSIKGWWGGQELECSPHEERLGDGVFFGLDRSHLWRQLRADPRYLWRGLQEGEARLFTTVSGGRTRYTRHTLKWGRSKLHARKNIISKWQSDTVTGTVVLFASLGLVKIWLD